MNHIFFGTPEFAAIILEKLIKAGYIPSAVICNPDRPVGRKKIITPPATKIIAQKYNIPVLQPESLKTKNLAFGEVLDESQNDSNSPKLALIKSIFNNNNKSNSVSVDNFQSHGPTGNRTPETRVLISDSNHSRPMANLLYQNWDFFVVAVYSQIIPKEILEIPRLGTIGVHPSLLPKYRGASPIQTAILNGEETTGTTLYLMDEKLDSGLILATNHLSIATNETYKSLHDKLAKLSADLLIETLPNIEKEIKNAKPQNESQVTYTKKFLTENAFIKPEDLKEAQNDDGEIANKIERKIRALNPEPGVFTYINDKRTKLLEAKIIEGKLKLTKIQVEGKKPTLF